MENWPRLYEEQWLLSHKCRNQRYLYNLNYYFQWGLFPNLNPQGFSIFYKFKTFLSFLTSFLRAEFQRRGETADRKRKMG